jgi:hypothetical protein
MPTDQNIIQENEKRYPRLLDKPDVQAERNGFDEILYWSKCDTYQLEWYFEQRLEFPPVSILTNYLKLIYLYAKENDLMEK